MLGPRLGSCVEGAWKGPLLLFAHPVGFCDLRLVTGSTGNRAKDRESFWGFGHLGKVRE